MSMERGSKCHGIDHDGMVALDVDDTDLRPRASGCRPISMVRSSAIVLLQRARWVQSDRSGASGMMRG
jgi:hypothetical protein